MSVDHLSGLSGRHVGTKVSIDMCLTVSSEVMQDLGPGGVLGGVVGLPPLNR